MNKSQIVIVGALAVTVVGLVVLSQSDSAVPAPAAPAAPQASGATVSTATEQQSTTTPSVVPAPTASGTATVETRPPRKLSRERRPSREKVTSLEQARKVQRDHTAYIASLSPEKYAELRAKKPTFPEDQNVYLGRLRTHMAELEKMTQEEWQAKSEEGKAAAGTKRGRAKGGSNVAGEKPDETDSSGTAEAPPAPAASTPSDPDAAATTVQ